LTIGAVAAAAGVGETREAVAAAGEAAGDLTAAAAAALGEIMGLLLTSDFKSDCMALANEE